MKHNIYTCQTCGFRIKTEQDGDDMTPFSILCVNKKCKGFMFSSMHQVPEDDDTNIAYRWVPDKRNAGYARLEKRYG